MRPFTFSRILLYFSILLFLTSSNGLMNSFQNITYPSVLEEQNIRCDGPVAPMTLTDKKCRGPTCVNYEMFYLILLENSDKQFVNVFDFLKILPRGCAADSTSFIITPQCSQNINGADCHVKKYKNLYGAMEALKLPNSFSPLSNSTAANDMFQMLSYALQKSGDPFDFHGGTLTLITDMNCIEFCNSQLPSYFHLTFQQFNAVGYQLAVYLTGKDSTSGACRHYFESLNVTLIFGLPLEGAESGCLLPPSTVDYCNITSDKVNPETPSTNTNNKLIVMGYLLQNWNMQDFENFIREVIGDCNDNDIIQIIYPDKAGPEIVINSANIDSLLTHTDIYTFYVAYSDQYQVTLNNVFYYLSNAAAHTNLDLNTYIYIFTDVDCLWFCNQAISSDGSLSAPNYVESILTSLYNAGFRVKIFQFPELTVSCKFFSVYWNSTGLPSIQTIPVAQNDIDLYSVCLSKRTTLAKLETSTVTSYKTSGVARTATSTSKPFVLATNAPKKMSDLKLGLLIGMTCFCLFLIALIVIFVMICQRRRSRARMLAAIKAEKLYLSTVEKDGLNDEKWSLPAENLLLSEADVLGHGAFGCVYKGKYKGDIPSISENAKLKMSMIKGVDGTYEVAVKRLPDYATEFQRLELIQEIEFMKKLGHHIHVIAMLGYVEHFDDPMIVLEYCENGDLHVHLQRLRQTKTEDELNFKEFVSFAWQIVNGLCYLHANNFVHRDIAARNILLTKNMVAKISDFGLCRQNDSAHYTSKGGKLPLRWMAIESLHFYEFSTKSDIWSYGVTIWELFSLGKSPYQTIQGDELASYLEAGNRLEIPDLCPESIAELLSQCWSNAQEERPHAEKLRTKLAGILDESSMYYGYLNFENETKTDEEYIEVKK